MKRYIVENDFVYEGLRCVVTFGNTGHRCGYVGVPIGHNLYGVDYDEAYDKIDVGVHGGLTYAGGNDEYPVESKLWWLGFDCAHSGDGKDLLLAKEYFKDNEALISQINLTMETDNRYSMSEYETVRTQNYVEQECRSLADQINNACGKVSE